MLNKVLPNIVKHVKIKKIYNPRNVGYNYKTDTLLFTKQITKDVTLKYITEKYINKKLNNREFTIFILLHELGHRYDKKTNNKTVAELHLEKEREFEKYDIMTYNMNLKEKAFYYWNNISTEKKAMDFAKKYFEEYLELKENKNE